MLGLNKSFVLFSMLSSLLLLAACGGDDAETTSTAAPVAETTSAPAMAEAAATETEASADSGGVSETLTIDQIEKAEGVIYQDEIYANWPTHE
ncbi:MAG: hypothetical protein ACPHLK_00655 [Gammaproteobacteria bacterium]|jgi:major membrane immunogen (membrane-anchored lipoprotein)